MPFTKNSILANAKMLLFSQSNTFTAKPPLKKKVFAQLQFGGDGGNRNRVRKFAHTTFYMLSLCFGIPFSYRS